MKQIKLKPLSVNKAWRGRHFSTPEKTKYERELLNKIQYLELDGEGPYYIHFRFHIPKLQDYDNCIKVTQDVICKHFGINDSEIFIAVIEKIAVKRGEEYFEIEIDSIGKRKFNFTFR